SAILVLGIGGLTLDLKYVQITSIATALIVGILVNLLMHRGKSPEEEEEEREKKYEYDKNEKLF
ncbi:MAG: hypothetical protein ACOYBD_02605, partial [Bilifractor sp.]